MKNKGNNNQDIYCTTYLKKDKEKRSLNKCD